MNVEVTKLPESRVALKVELTPQEVEGALDRTYKQLVQRVTVPGFRRGKAPRAVVERMVGAEYFIHEATDEAIRWGYRKAIEQESLTPIDEAEIGSEEDEHHHIEPGEPFHFEATVSVRPEVPLPDYHTISVKRENRDVTDEDVQALLNDLAASQSTLEPTARAAQVGDSVTMNVTGRVEGEEVLNQENSDYEIRGPEDGDENGPLPGLSKHLIGSTPGQIVETTIDLPETYYKPEIAGKTMSLRLIVKEVKTKVLPELDDDFASSVSRFDSLEELRDALRHNLELERKAEADQALVQQAVDEVVNRTFLDIPPILIEEELDRMVGEMRDTLARSGLSLDQYFQATGSSEEAMRNETRESAVRNVKTSLVVGAIADAEGIEVSKGEIDRELEALLRATPMPEKERRALRTNSGLRSNIRSRLRRARAVRRLVEIVSGDEVSDEATDALVDGTSASADDAQETVAVEAGG